MSAYTALFFTAIIFGLVGLILTGYGDDMVHRSRRTERFTTESQRALKMWGKILMVIGITILVLAAITAIIGLLGNIWGAVGLEGAD